MSDTPWTDKHRDRMTVHIDDVMELERSHRRLLEALKSIEGEARLAIATRAIQRPCAGLMVALDSSSEAIKQAIC